MAADADLCRLPRAPAVPQVPRRGHRGEDRGRRGPGVQGLPPGLPDRRRHPSVPRGRGQAPMTAGDGAHILVLEDDPSVQTLLRKQLVAHGFKVSLATDGLDGLMKLETLSPDLMICDVMMPNLDGVEFVK